MLAHLHRSATRTAYTHVYTWAAPLTTRLSPFAGRPSVQHKPLPLPAPLDSALAVHRPLHQRWQL